AWDNGSRALRPSQPCYSARPLALPMRVHGRPPRAEEPPETMTPKNDPAAGKRTSGNPATQAKIELTVKQPREAQKQAKLAEYQKQLARRRRSKLLWWVVGGVAVLLVVVVVAASFWFAPKPVPAATYGEHDSTGAQIEGVVTFENVTTHVEGAVDYPQNPPAGGPHNPYWLNCGIYNEPQQNENAVHSLEHGAVWVTYDASQVGEEDIKTLRTYLPSSYVILSPYEGLPSPV